MIFLTIFLSIYCLRLRPDFNTITKFIEKIFMVLIIFVVLDGIYINYIGSVNHLVEFFGKAGYRNLPNPVFFEYTANGLIFGAQHASIISCAGIIMFFPHNKLKLSRNLLFVLSIIGLTFSVTNTSLASLLFAIIIAYFLSSWEPLYSTVPTQSMNTSLEFIGNGVWKRPYKF